MLRSLTLLLLFSVSSLSEAKADQPLPESAEQPTQARGPRWTVQVDPLTAALGFAHVQVEYALADHHAVYLGPHLRFYDSLLDDEEQDYTTLGLESAYRYFWQGQAPRGPWVQGRLVVSYLMSEEEDTPGGYISALGGYTWILGGRWVLALGGGVQYIHMKVGELGRKGVLPAAHTALGVAF